MAEELLREQLNAQIKNRAMMYFHIFNELREEIGEERAIAIMKRAIYKRGLEISNLLKQHAPADLDGLKETFINKIVPDEGRVFSPEVLRCDGQELEMKLMQCPLKAAYREAGLSDKETATMLNIAAQVDYGTFEGAGFDVRVETWQPGRTGCCHLHIQPKSGG